MKYLKEIIVIILLACNERETTSRVKNRLEQKVKKLNELNAKQSVIRFNLKMFKDYVISEPRNYSVVVMFNAMGPERQCRMCPPVYDTFMILANSFWLSEIRSNKLFFGIVDVDGGTDIFEMLRLTFAPVIRHFPADLGKPPVQMDLMRVGIEAEAYSRWIERQTGVKIQVCRPINYLRLLIISFVLILVFGLLYKINETLLYNRNIWAVTALLLCFAMISGQVWNHINKPPFILYQKDRTQFMADKHTVQFVIESYMVAFLYATIVSGMILLIECAGGVRESSEGAVQRKPSRRRRSLLVLGLMLVCVPFFVLMHLSQLKLQSYPYSFL